MLYYSQSYLIFPCLLNQNKKKMLFTILVMKLQFCCITKTSLRTPISLPWFPWQPFSSPGPSPPWTIRTNIITIEMKGSNTMETVPVRTSGCASNRDCKERGKKLEGTTR